MAILTVVNVIKDVLTKTLPFVAAAALSFPAARKLLAQDWREELGMSYQLGDQNVGATFFLLIGLVEAAMAVLMLVPKTRVVAGLAMGGFFMGALVFNLGLRVDQSLLPNDASTLANLIPLDISHLLIGFAVAALWRNRQSESRYMA